MVGETHGDKSTQDSRSPLVHSLAEGDELSTRTEDILLAEDHIQLKSILKK